MSPSNLLQLPPPPNRDDIITVSPSGVSSWQRCKYQWYLSYIEGFTSGSNKSYERGKLVHKFEESFYNLYIGQQVTPIEAEQFNEIRKEHENQFAKIEDIAMFYWALSTFGRYTEFAALNDDFIPLATEVELFVPTDLEFGGKQVYLHGILDLVFERAGEIGVMDHKSHYTERGRWTAAMVYFDQQLAMYGLMLHMLGFEPKVAVINSINVFEYKNIAREPLEKLFNRETVTLNPKRLGRYRDNIYAIIKDMRTSAEYPMNLTQQCPKMCGYSNVCDNRLRGLDYKSVLLQNHRRKEEGQEEFSASFPISMEDLV